MVYKHTMPLLKISYEESAIKSKPQNAKPRYVMWTCRRCNITGTLGLEHLEA